ncbi:MAG: Bax inhibitor-1/YccA family protein [Bacteroides sp.]|nr:Bax inhibitor-1/YccA family protein [Bacteroides sp.]MCM1447489.1 Bax inhibitor-1/YccA family protein [Bacteroides sp.]MCM1516178.1 Bax inhibitor-1/YccA family protein [Paraprevotella sp.]
MGYDKMEKNNSYAPSSVASETSVFAVLMRNVYTWMTCGLMMTALTAMIVGRNENWLYALATSGMYWGLLIAEVVLVIFLSARIHKMSFATAGIMFAAYAILNGATLSFIMAIYTAESIAQAFFVTAGTFGAMSLVGFFVKKDLSAIGRVMIMALIGLIIATVVNIFWQNSLFASVLNYLGVIVFVALTAYDTQKIKQMLAQAQQFGVNDDTNKLALMGSLTLYLDFVNLFLYILRLFGNRK